MRQNHQWNWYQGYIPPYDPKIIEQRPKSVKIKSDLSMIFNHCNLNPLIEWFDLWKQLFRHIVHG